jgi:predicted SprT family Zn-dependent metalloprotease
MLKADAKALALQLMGREGLVAQGWGVEFNNRRVHLGNCFYSAKTIELSRHFVENHSEEEIKEVILHEIAHALLKGIEEGHGPLWKAECRRLGISPDRCYDAPNMPSGKWEAKCSICDRIFKRYNKPTNDKTYFCGKCPKSDKTKLEWSKNAT